MRYSISIIKQGVVNLKAKWSEQNSRAVAILLRLLHMDHCISLRCRHTHTDCKMVWQQVVWTLESWQPEDCKGKTGSLLAVTARALTYTCNTPIMPTGSAGIEWPAPDRISSDQVQVSLSVKCFTTGRILPLTEGRMEMPGISLHSGPPFLRPFGIPSCSSLPWYFLGVHTGGGNSFEKFGYVPLDCIRKLNCKLPLEFPFFNLFLENKCKNIPERNTVRRILYVSKSEQNSIINIIKIVIKY